MNNVAKYIEYKADQLGITYQEAADLSINLIKEFLSEQNCSFFMLGLANDTLLSELDTELLTNKWGRIPVLVHSETTKKTFFLVKSKEKHLSEKILNILLKYNDSNAILQQDGVIRQIFKDGSCKLINESFNINNLASLYQRLSSSDETFFIEAAGDNSRITNWTVEKYFKKGESCEKICRK